MEPIDIFEPYKIKDNQLKNRLIMSLFPCELIENGQPLPGYVDFFKKRAAGVGLIVVSGPSLDAAADKSAPSAKKLDLSLGKEAFGDILDAVHAHDSKLLVQLSHSGKFTDKEAVTASAIHQKASRSLSDLSLQELRSIEQRFIDQAKYAGAAGFDGVEIQAGYGHLIQSLLSPLTNTRVDEYGGAPAERSRFLLNVLTGIRKAVNCATENADTTITNDVPEKLLQSGKRFLIQLKLCVDEFEPHGLRFPEVKKFVQSLPDDLVDIILITAGSGRTKEMAIPTSYLPDAYLRPFAAHLKKITKIPIAIGGKIRTPPIMRQLLDEGSADLIALSRPLFADPELPLKMMIGADHEIRPCIACDQCTIRSKEYRGRRCSVNPTAFIEAELETAAGDLVGNQSSAGGVPLSKMTAGKVAIVGGGPAGMQAAITLAHYGSYVALFEKNSYLGGRFEFACRDENKRPYRSFLNYLTQTLLNARVDIRLDAAINDLADLAGFDTVIVATGANYSTVKINGERTGRTLTIDQFYEKNADNSNITEFGNVLIIGAQRSGIEIADQISVACEKAGTIGEKVVVVADRSNDALKSMNKISRKVLLSRLKKRNVDVRLSTDVIGFDGDIVTLRAQESGPAGDPANGESADTQFIANTVIIAAGVGSENALFEKLQQSIKDRVPDQNQDQAQDQNDSAATIAQPIPKLYLIGDADEPGDLGHALRSAYFTALRIKNNF